MSKKDDEQLGREFNRISQLQRNAEREHSRMNKYVVVALGAIALVLIIMGVIYMAGGF